MTKEEERERLVKKIGVSSSKEFLDACEEQGFTVCFGAEESTEKKKKANL